MMKEVVLDCDAVASSPHSFGTGSADSQTRMQSSLIASSGSTPFPTSSAKSEGSVKTIRPSRSYTSLARERPRVGSTSSSKSLPRSILLNEPVVQVTPAPLLPVPIATSPEVTSDSSLSSPSSSESELQTPVGDDSSNATLASSSSSCINADSAASIRTRTTTLSSTSGGLSVKFAPLPEIGQRQRKSSRPLGLAARGQILRERRMLKQQEHDDGNYVYPGEENLGRKKKDGNDKTRRDNLEDQEVAIAALGKMLGEATKALWQRVKAKNNEPIKWAKPARGLTWPRPGTKPQTSEHGSDEDSESDVEGPYSRRKDEDPMTKTIMQRSHEELDQFVFAYDSIPVSEEDEQDEASARANEELRASVQVHLANACEVEPKV